MDQEPKPIEDEQDIAARSEAKESQLEEGLEKLERPPAGDFVAGLRNFIDWVKSLVAKKD